MIKALKEPFETVMDHPIIRERSGGGDQGRWIERIKATRMEIMAGKFDTRTLESLSPNRG